MKQTIRIARFVLSTLLLITLSPVAAQDAPPPATLTLAAYSTPREVYGEVIPLFQAYWLEQTNQQVIVQETYQGSGALSRAIVGGFDADIAALSLEADITRIVDAGLITHDWKDNDYQGFISTSIVVLAVRPDNPLNIADWVDLVQPELEVITPDPATSGGAQWNVLAAYGAVRHGYVEGYEATDEGATQFLRDLFTNVITLDRDARESFLNFERGVGDVAITYENEVYTGLAADGEYQLVRPTSTILIENPVAVIDSFVDAHGTREVAEAFVDFLWTPEVQTIFANHGYRSVNPDVAAEYQTPEGEAAMEVVSAENEHVTFAPIEDLFTIEEFGGWGEARPAFFGDEGIFTTLIAEIQGS